MWKSYESAAVCSGVRRLSSISLASFPSSPLWMRSEKDDAAIKMSFTRFRGKRKKILCIFHTTEKKERKAGDRNPCTHTRIDLCCATYNCLLTSTSTPRRSIQSGPLCRLLNCRPCPGSFLINSSLFPAPLDSRFIRLRRLRLGVVAARKS